MTDTQTTFDFEDGKGPVPAHKQLKPMKLREESSE